MEREPGSMMYTLIDDWSSIDEHTPTSPAHGTHHGHMAGGRGGTIITQSR